MNPLTPIEVKLCQAQARMFEDSVSKTSYSSPIFIRRFMHSSIAKSLDDRLYLYQSDYIDSALYVLDEEFGVSSYGKTKYSKDQMYWIGYIYRCISIKYNLSSKSVYKLFNADEIVKYYNICHTFDIVDAAERMMESIGYNNRSLEERVYELMKRLHYIDKLSNLLGQDVEVIIDKPAGFKSNDITYTQNYGHIKDLKALNNDFQGTYVIGENKPLESFNGKVIAIVNRTNDTEDRVVVCDKSKNFTKKQIKELIHFQEKHFKSKIIIK